MEKEKLENWLKRHPKMKECLKNYDIENIFISGGDFNEKIGSSFFYEGEVFVFEFKDRILFLEVCGDIRIYKNDELIFDVKERNEGFGFEVKTDEDLKKVNEENGFVWENNNWFECGFKRKDSECYDYLADVYFDMEEAFLNIILWLKNNEWWEDKKEVRK